MRFLAALLLASLGVSATLFAAEQPQPPNIVVILADDLGYGDVRCYNSDRGKIPTPHIDRLAAQGMRFTDAHSSSGVCSPSRYIEAIGSEASSIIRAAAEKHVARLIGSWQHLTDEQKEQTIGAMEWALDYWMDVVLGFINTQGSGDSYGHSTSASGTTRFTAGSVTRSWRMNC